MVTICLQCGDKGFSNALVYCVKCLNFAVHRYCLDKMPNTFDEFVYWVCDDCEVKFPVKVTSLNPTPTKFEGRDHTSSKHFEEQRTVVTRKGGKRRRPRIWYRVKKRKRTTSLQGEPGQRLESRLGEQPKVAESSISSLESTELKRKESSCSGAKVENDILQPAETNAELAQTKISNRVHELSSFEKSKEKWKEANSSVANSTGKDAKNFFEVSQLASSHLENNSCLVFDEHAKPLIEPIWRGGFIILNKDYGAFDGLVAHLSCRVGQKVYDEARLFPSLLDLEMYPKEEVWPRSFQKSKPTDDNIALYFFPLEKRYERLFDHLVEDMMNEKLALRATLENAELLVFPSTELPDSCWRFQGKYYLWGVFRGKQVPSSQAVGLHSGITEAKNPAKAGNPLSLVS